MKVEKDDIQLIKMIHKQFHLATDEKVKNGGLYPIRITLCIERCTWTLFVTN